VEPLEREPNVHLRGTNNGLMACQVGTKLLEMVSKKFVWIIQRN
jgi:hypothetical protein